MFYLVFRVEFINYIYIYIYIYIYEDCIKHESIQFKFEIIIING
jgi:hypothetical protein